MLSKLTQSFSRSQVVLRGPSAPVSRSARFRLVRQVKANYRSPALSLLGLSLTTNRQKNHFLENISRQIKCSLFRQYASKALKQASNESKPTCTFPYAEASFLELISRPHVFYVDKTYYIPKLEDIGRAVVLLAPRRFGKSLFLDTLTTYYDISRKEKFYEDFGHLWIGQNPTELANKFHILRIDFSEIDRKDNYVNFKASLDETLNDAIVDFCERYCLKNFQKGTTGTKSFSKLCRQMKNEDKQMMVIIDEYDNILNSVLGRASFKDRQSELEQMEDVFKAFFSTLKSRIGCGHVRTFIAGVSPVVLAEFTSGFNVAVYPQREADCADLFGMTIQDVNDGLSMMKLPHGYQHALLNHMITLHDGYSFNSKVQHTLFNPNRVQYLLYHIQKLLKFDPSASVESLIADLYSTEDPNTSPAESTLRLMSSNPLATKIVTNCLNLDDGTVAEPLTCKFKLTDMAKLDKQGETALLSWMFFNGALTYAYAPNPPSRLKIPNLIARQEYLQELHHLIQLDQSTIVDFQTAIIDMIENQSITELKSCLENHLLHLLQGRDVIDQEQAIQSKIQNTLLASLAICKRPLDRVYSEYKVDPVKRATNIPGSDTVDIVYQSCDKLSNGSISKKRFVFEIKNVQARSLYGNQVGKIWEEQVEASLKLHQLTDEKLKQLKYMPYGKQGHISIQSLIDDTKFRQLVPYLKQMEKDATSEGHSIGFVVVRVGLSKLITEKL